MQISNVSSVKQFCSTLCTTPYPPGTFQKGSGLLRYRVLPYLSLFLSLSSGHIPTCRVYLSPEAMSLRLLSVFLRSRHKWTASQLVCYQTETTSVKDVRCFCVRPRMLGVLLDSGLHSPIRVDQTMHRKNVKMSKLYVNTSDQNGRLIIFLL